LKIFAVLRLTYLVRATRSTGTPVVRCDDLGPAYDNICDEAGNFEAFVVSKWSHREDYLSLGRKRRQEKEMFREAVVEI
jgi:hypothetical protein